MPINLLDANVVVIVGTEEGGPVVVPALDCSLGLSVVLQAAGRGPQPSGAVQSSWRMGRYGTAARDWRQY